ncbi:HAD-IA family hydrolase [Paenibacillus athensensis]|uniref:Uncharacterized protein n=1 Tax=Paenibacillus athensensis TaxID=1967502 RepID=A0A4Y8PXU1_9BACL|nr:HAD-IA family hydrolase [Paenibacillus athensensis]MCD1259372.1 HAD-IA family hydrolase [Paenibacillus athensensis]
MQYILFDLDGVLIDSEHVIKTAFTLSYHKVVGDGVPPVEEYLTHMGDSFENIMVKMNLPLVMKEHFQYYSRHLVGFIRPHRGIMALLRLLRANQYQMAVVTGKDRSRTVEILQKLKMDDYFLSVVAADDVERPKPEPDALIAAMRHIQAVPEQTIMVGDAPNDLIAAKRAGVRSCAVSWGVTPARQLIGFEPDFLVKSPHEIASLFSKVKIELNA